MYKGVAYLHQDRIESVLRTAEVLQVVESEISSNLITKLQKNFPFFEKMLKSLMDIAKQFRGRVCSILKKKSWKFRKDEKWQQAEIKAKSDPHS